MAAPFPLAGLLRLRQSQQDVAASYLAAANARMSANRDRMVHARSALDGTLSVVTDTAALHALAAARASSRSMLADLQILERDHQADLTQAQSAFSAARAKSIGLEKLEGRHTETVAAEQLRAEQSVLDEIASRAWHSTRKGSTS